MKFRAKKNIKSGTKSAGSDPRRDQLWVATPKADFFSRPVLTPDILNYLPADSRGVGHAFSERFRVASDD